MSTYTALPIRHPNTQSRTVMTRRAWWLVAMNFLIPGSAQVLAGNRRLGRIGLIATLTMWVLVVAALLLYLATPQTIYNLATNSYALLLAQIVLVAYAFLWIVLTINTLSLVKLIRARPSSRAWIALATVALLVVSVGGAGAGAYYAGITRGTLQSIFGGGAASVPPVDGHYNILLLGGDAGPDREGLRPDSMSVVSVDAETGAATMIGLPRDLHNMPFSDGSPMKKLYPNGYGYNGRCDVSACMLNSVYTEAEVRHPDLYPDAIKNGSRPGIEATKEAIEGTLDLEIQYYVLIDMQGFSDLIDALGGVDITVPKRVPVGGDENLVGVAEWIEVGEHHMNGYYALWYARSRHGSSDYERMERQRQLQAAILKQFTPANVLSKFQVIAQAGSQVVKTDIPQDMLGYFVELALKTKELPITNIELTPASGIQPEEPDFDKIRSMVDAALHPASPAPSGG